MADFFKTRPRPKWMRCLTVGCFFMSLGFIIRFSRRHHINAWAFIFETLVSSFQYHFPFLLSGSNMATRLCTRINWHFYLCNSSFFFPLVLSLPNCTSSSLACPSASRPMIVWSSTEKLLLRCSLLGISLRFSLRLLGRHFKRLLGIWSISVWRSVYYFLRFVKAL